MEKILINILNEIKEANKYELNQTDSFTQQVQLLFLIASVIFATSFLGIENLNKYIFIGKISILFFILIALYFALPYLKKRNYTPFPNSGSLIKQLDNNIEYLDYIKNLITNYKDNYLNNKTQNIKRESDFLNSVRFLCVAAILMLFLFSYYFYLDYNSEQIPQNKQEVQMNSSDDPYMIFKSNFKSYFSDGITINGTNDLSNVCFHIDGKLIDINDNDFTVQYILTNKSLSPYTVKSFGLYHNPNDIYKKLKTNFENPFEKLIYFRQNEAIIFIEKYHKSHIPARIDYLKITIEIPGFGIITYKKELKDIKYNAKAKK